MPNIPTSATSMGATEPEERLLGEVRATREIDAAIADNRRPIEQLEEEFPFITVSHIDV